MAIDGLTKLSPTISVHDPQQPVAGQLIILGTWMGAADKHIAKYIVLHRQQAPGVRILLLKSYVTSMISSYRSQQKAMVPAEHYLHQFLEECGYPGNQTVKPRILLHMFSNGGTNSVTQLLVPLQKKIKAPIPFVGLICDSCPIGGSYFKTYHAFMHSVPKGAARVFAPVIIHILLSLLYLSIACGRYEQPEELWRKTLLDQNLIKSKKITYIASKTDVQTDWRDVVSHANDAKKQGWDVKEIIFDDTPHCNHYSKNEEIYVDAIVNTWKKT